MNKMPLDSQLDPEKIKALIMINKMLNVLEDPSLDSFSKKTLTDALDALIATYLKELDNSVN